MNKKENGFTLIELLAVIVILAIIALIATPIILGIVEDARKDAFLRSVELVVSTTDTDIFNKTYTDSYTYEIVDGNISNLEVGIKNTNNMNGSITYDSNGNEEYAIHNGKYCVRKYKGLSKAEIRDYKEGICVIPTDINNILTNISFNHEAVTYDGTAKEVIVNGVPEGLRVEYPDGNKFTNAGEYKVKAIIHGNDVYSGTHELETTFIINKAPLAITADNKKSIVGKPLVELTYTLTGTIYGTDDLKIKLTKEDGTDIGEYQITVSSENNNNYEISYIPGKYNIYYTFYTFKDDSDPGDEIPSEKGKLVNLGEQGIRYQGSDPDNYVYFNCSNYNNQTSETCEIWRIIGEVDGKVKIIKNERIGKIGWDDPNGNAMYDDNEVNDWKNATLKTYLNEDYLNSLNTKNSETVEMILASTWYLRGHKTAAVTKDTMYNLERTTGTVKHSTASIENTNIGLMYPSDYAYAALETDSCLSTTTLSSYNNCINSNWLYNKVNEWLITPYSSNSIDSFFVTSSGLVECYGDSGVYDTFAVRPSLNLSSLVEIKDGLGTKNAPYQLLLNK